MFHFSIRKLSDIQAPTLLNNGTQYSSASNNCEIMENSILECINVNADRDALNADLINSNQIEKIHSDNSAFREIINKEFDDSLTTPSHSLSAFLNSNSSNTNLLNGRIFVPETGIKLEINGSTVKNFNLNTGR
jgi:hypothetical protein